ncbi:YdaS family helix-turn-helix protein [Photorhabdus hindustanensis]
MNILDIAIKEVGGIPALAKMLSIRDQVVHQWDKKGYVSPSRR